jgi:hypothetical protein
MAKNDDSPDMSYSRLRAKRKDWGIKCTECHCTDLRTSKTQKIGDLVKRWRYCRNCGEGPIITFEAGASPAADASKRRRPKE